MLILVGVEGISGSVSGSQVDGRYFDQFSFLGSGCRVALVMSTAIFWSMAMSTGSRFRMCEIPWRG